ncbi:MAG: hypothetical protein KGO96_03340 [Elusimicrobia bacterium]|nr:hypothetical protein [Elusimicrobiota bacterium]MDE2424926.1 hypothetical protein [Elusimicrobiota bacterium]
MLAWLACVLLVCPARADDYPIRPVHIVLHAASDRIVADVTSDSIYWIEEVVRLEPMPSRNWPRNAMLSAQNYVNAHLRLQVDGKPLEGRLLRAVYVQRPWQVYEQGTFHLRLVYPAVPEAAVISGSADFFSEYRQERLVARQPLLPIMDFRTVLSVAGRRPRRFVLTPGKDDFSFAVADALPGRAQRLWRALGAGAWSSLAAQGWPALAALALSLGPGCFSLRRALALMAAALLGAVAPLPAPSWLPWAAGLAAALAAGRWLAAASAAWLEAAALAALSRFWAAAALAALPAALPQAMERLGVWAGVLAAAMALLLAGALACACELRRLALISQSGAARLYEGRRRLAATGLLIVCAAALASWGPR